MHFDSGLKSESGDETYGLRIKSAMSLRSSLFTNWAVLVDPYLMQNYLIQCLLHSNMQFYLFSLKRLLENFVVIEPHPQSVSVVTNG